MDPFFDLRKHAGSNHPQKCRLNVVLAAIEEVILERRGQPSSEEPPSSVEYFAAFMTALEGGDISSAEDVRFSYIALVLMHGLKINCSFSF